MPSELDRAVKGRLFAAGASRYVPGTIGRDGEAFVFSAHGERWLRPADELVHVSARVGRTSRRLKFADGSQFETDDNDGIDALLPGRRGGGTWLSGMERFRWRLAGFVVATILAAVIVVRYALPVAADVAAALTPPSVATLIDTSTMRTIDAVLAEPSTLSAATRDEVTSSFADLLADADRESDAYTVLFRQIDRVGPNAFALPGGTIVFTDALIERLEMDEIIAVAAHEIAHVDERHGLERVYRALGFSAMAGLVTGDYGELAGELAELGGVLTVLANSRAAEREADTMALAMLADTGRAPDALGRALAAIVEHCADCGEASYLSTHPGIEERLAAIEAFTEERQGR